MATILDEKTWDAIGIGGVIPGGRIVKEECLLTDLGKQYHVSEFPVEIPLGHEVYGTGVGENTASYNQEMQLSVDIIDPEGISRGYNSWSDLILPSHYIYLVTGNVEIDKKGIWKFHVKLENAGVFDEKTWDAVAVGVKPPRAIPWLWIGVGIAAASLVGLVAAGRKRNNETVFVSGRGSNGVGDIAG